MLALVGAAATVLVELEQPVRVVDDELGNSANRTFAAD